MIMSVEDSVVKIIKDRKLKVNDRLPSQREIGQVIGKSQFTVQQAMQQLVAQGILRIEGKKVFDMTFPKDTDGGVYSKTNIEIDNNSILRLKYQMIPPEEI